MRSVKYNLKCCACSKDALVLSGGQSLCKKHYAINLTETKYYALLNKRSRDIKKDSTRLEQLSLPDRDKIYAVVLEAVLRMYGDDK